MEKLYLVKYDGNYADEFDVYFHQVMTQGELDEAKNLITRVDWNEECFYFGTNEEIYVWSSELLEALNHAIEITPEQNKVLVDLGIADIGFGDGLNWNGILERAYDQLEDNA